MNEPLSKQHSLRKGKYHCSADLQFDWFGFSCFTYVEFKTFTCLVESKQKTGGPPYSFSSQVREYCLHCLYLTHFKLLALYKCKDESHTALLLQSSRLGRRRRSEASNDRTGDPLIRCTNLLSMSRRLRCPEANRCPRQSGTNA